MPTMRELAAPLRRAHEGHGAARARMFEEMGFNYIGPIDGHDLKALVPAPDATSAT